MVLDQRWVTSAVADLDRDVEPFPAFYGIWGGDLRGVLRVVPFAWGVEIRADLTFVGLLFGLSALLACVVVGR